MILSAFWALTRPRERRPYNAQLIRQCCLEARIERTGNVSPLDASTAHARSDRTHQWSERRTDGRREKCTGSARIRCNLSSLAAVFLTFCCRGREREGEDEKKKFVEEQTHTVRIEKKKRK